MTAPDFGLEALYKLQSIDTKKNALILLVHFVLTKNGWLYVGRGTEWKENETGTESLPAGWAGSDQQYRYVSRTESRKKFIINFVEHDVFLLVNMVNIEDQVAIAMNINTSTQVDSTQLASNNPRLVFPKLLDLLSEIHDKLVRPCQVATRTVGTSTATSASSASSDRRSGSTPQYDPPPHPLREPNPNPLLRGEVPYGRRDLDPFLGHGSGGGMILDPLRERRDNRFAGPFVGPDGVPLPRGAVPPGARFDPFFPEAPINPDLGNPPNMDPFHPNARFRPPYGPFGGGPGSGADFI